MDLQNASELMEPNFEQFNILLRNSNSNLGLIPGDTSSSHTHQLVSTNSFELNTGTSISENSDSGLAHTNSSISSGDSIRIGLCKFEFELAESDGEVSQFDSLDNCSDGGMSAENFNTLKKGPLAPIDPPPEFQDSPQTTLLRSPALQSYAMKLSKNLITTALNLFSPDDKNKQQKSIRIASMNFTHDCNARRHTRPYELYASDSGLNIHPTTDNIYDIPNADSEESLECVKSNVNSVRSYQLKPKEFGHHKALQSRACEIHDYDVYYNGKKSGQMDSFHRRKTPVLYSPLHYHPGSSLSNANRPNSRNSLNSRLSSSHNSLTVPTTNKADDSIFITQAMSHDALISDFYNVPIDSDIYALPVDVIKPELHENRSNGYKNLRGKLKYVRNTKKRRKPNANDSVSNEKYSNRSKTNNKYNDKRHSVPENTIEPMHMTLDEVKRFYHSLYSSSSDSSDAMTKKCAIHNKKNVKNINNNIAKNVDKQFVHQNNNNTITSVKVNKVPVNLKNKKISTKVDCGQKYGSNSTGKKSQFSINLNLKQKFCSIFRFRKPHTNSSQQNEFNEYDASRLTSDVSCTDLNGKQDKRVKFSTRALPPLPGKGQSNETEQDEQKEEKRNEENTMDFAANIEKVKEYGWYWGPISSESAEKILSNEPDGSFIVRDSSDDHYIFSLTFKLNNTVRHVRIEQDQGTFSFGSCAKFKSHTIMEFIENAVESSRSGRYLFFFHRRPEHGPMRVQLTNPVSRFKHIQSLQHMCRFVIRKAVVRKDLIQTLPLPRRLLDYISYKNCYSEQVECDSSPSLASDDGIKS
ncbi:Suppressor of cytokine signaling 7 [Pseudolycoriella hygida]|uniref:Suppressor of cytokine signaling 7 n=1 Tax=Pseudolycoriella hygida TaxID=35572 RepID=A0A9Q0MVU7_9DIPT|nr:Suppressor of cytokine signaling 7 [Pseudolycoriella hygida]